MLAGLECGFTIHQPEELRASVRALAGRLTAAAWPASVTAAAARWQPYRNGQLSLRPE